LTIRHDKLEDSLASAATQTPGALTAEFTEYALQLGPHRLTLGTANVIAPRMALTNLDELKAAVGTAVHSSVDGHAPGVRVRSHWLMPAATSSARSSSPRRSA
jgi:hypothetical protein